MKKLIFTLVALCLLSTQTYGESIVFHQGKFMMYNEIWKKFFDHDYALAYDMDNHTLTFFTQEGITTIAITLDKGAYEQLAAHIDKFFEWEAKATKKGVELEKEIGLFHPKYVGWRFGDGDYQLDRNALGHVTFFSQNPKYHQLIIDIDKLQSDTNTFSKHRPKNYYFSSEQAKELRSQLTMQAIAKSIAERDVEKALADEFN